MCCSCQHMQIKVTGLHRKARLHIYIFLNFFTDLCVLGREGVLRCDLHGKMFAAGFSETSEGNGEKNNMKLYLPLAQLWVQVHGNCLVFAYPILLTFNTYKRIQMRMKLGISTVSAIYPEALKHFSRIKGVAQGPNGDATILQPRDLNWQPSVKSMEA